MGCSSSITLGSSQRKVGVEPTDQNNKNSDDSIPKEGDQNVEGNKDGQTLNNEKENQTANNNTTPLPLLPSNNHASTPSSSLQTKKVLQVIPRNDNPFNISITPSPQMKPANASSLDHHHHHHQHQTTSSSLPTRIDPLTPTITATTTQQSISRSPARHSISILKDSKGLTRKSSHSKSGAESPRKMALMPRRGSAPDASLALGTNSPKLPSSKSHVMTRRPSISQANSKHSANHSKNSPSKTIEQERDPTALSSSECPSPSLNNKHHRVPRPRSMSVVDANMVKQILTNDDDKTNTNTNTREDTSKEGLPPVRVSGHKRQKSLSIRSTSRPESPHSKSRSTNYHNESSTPNNGGGHDKPSSHRRSKSMIQPSSRALIANDFVRSSTYDRNGDNDDDDDDEERDDKTTEGRYRIDLTRVDEGVNPLSNLSTDQLRACTQQVCRAIFRAYQSSSSSGGDQIDYYLEKALQIKLCEDLVGRVCQSFAEEMKQKYPDISESDLEKAIKIEREYLIPGGGTNHETASIRAAILGMGIIKDKERWTKAEFCAAFGGYAPKLFVFRTDGALQMGCIIS